MDYAAENEGVTDRPPVTPAPRLMDEVRRRIRLKHYSLRTEQAYVGWIRRFILANGKRHPRGLGADEVEGFLSTLATVGEVAAACGFESHSAFSRAYRQRFGTSATQTLRGATRASTSVQMPVGPAYGRTLSSGDTSMSADGMRA